MNASVVNYQGKPRQLTTAGSSKLRQLTAEGHLSNLLVCFSQPICVYNNFLEPKDAHMTVG